MTLLATLAAMLTGAAITALTTRAAYRAGVRAGVARSIGALQILRAQLAVIDAERAAAIESAADTLDAP